MGNWDKIMRVGKIRALETLCSGMPDCDKHFLAERLMRYGSSGSAGSANIDPLTDSDFHDQSSLVNQ